MVISLLGVAGFKVNINRVLSMFHDQHHGDSQVGAS